MQCNKILKEYPEVCNIFLKQNKRKESGDGEINRAVEIVEKGGIE